MTKTTLDEDVQATLERLEEKDRGLKQFLKKAYGYAVFPSVGKAALVVGGSYGRGEVFERGKMIGVATVAQTTIGVQVGGETYSQIIAFESKETLDRFKKGKLAFAANASAVLVKAGAAAAANYEKGAVVFVYAEGGMLLELSIGGQKFKFKPGEGGEESKQAGAQRSQGQEQSDQDEDDRDEDEQDEAGAGSGVMGTVQAAASKIGDFVKEHPVATTLVGTALAAGAALMIARTLRRSSQGDESDEQESGEDSGDDESADYAEDQADDQDRDDEQDEQEDEDEQPQRSRNNMGVGRMLGRGRRR
jgi:hypothetical protein